MNSNSSNSTTNRKNKKITAIVVAVFVVVISVIMYLYFRPFDSSTVQKTPLNTTDKPVGQTDYSQATKEQQNAATDTTAPTPTPSTDTPKNTSNPIPVSISYLGGTPLQVRVLIGELMQSGSCKLTIEKTGASPVAQSADVFPSASSTTCKGFTVDTSSLEKGTWTVTVTVTQGDRSGTASKEVAL